MPVYKFEAMDATGAEIRDVIEAPTEEEAQSTIRQMGYFVTMIRERDRPGSWDRPIPTPTTNKFSTPNAWAIAFGFALAMALLEGIILVVLLSGR